MRFRAPLLLAGKTATGIQVSDEVVEGLGSGKRPRVQVTINGHSYRSTVPPMGGVYMLPVSAENRSGAGVTAGDELDVELQLDTEPRAVTVPAELAAGLGEDTRACRFFDGLSYSHQRAYVDWIDQAKKPETRHARVVKTLAMLGDGRTRS